MLAISALSLLALTAPAMAQSGGDHQLPDVGACENIEAPTGNAVASHVYATGVQIYRWDGNAWVFVAPKAVLYSDQARTDIVGIHYAGPTWESFNGMKVVGRVVERCTADTTAIPWLLLEAVHDGKPDLFDRVTFIQRVNTVGGKAPTTPGAFRGQTQRIPYTADYYFYHEARVALD